MSTWNLIALAGVILSLILLLGCLFIPRDSLLDTWAAQHPKLSCFFWCSASTVLVTSIFATLDHSTLYLLLVTAGWAFWISFVASVSLGIEDGPSGGDDNNGPDEPIDWPSFDDARASWSQRELIS
jgi:hypothetical protein